MALLTSRRFFTWISIFGAVALASLLLSPMVGAEPINVFKAIQAWLHEAPGQRPYEVDILIDLRVPRIIMGFLTGAALAVVGAVFQALLRNPLATPYTLGVSSGGAFGAVLAFFMPSMIDKLPTIGHLLVFSWGPFNHVQLYSFFGSLLAMGIIYLLARTGEQVSTMELLLAGVTMGLIFSALILAVRYFAEPTMLVGMDRWMVGGLDGSGYKDVYSALPLFLPGLIWLMLMARGLDQISFGEELAAGRGVNVARLQKSAFFCGSLVTASVVAIAGPIGFVGLIVPHTVRRIVGADHRLLLPCTFLAGGSFLVVCDMIARWIIAPTELPVGIITSLLGGPFFIYLLIRGRRTGKMWEE